MGSHQEENFYKKKSDQEKQRTNFSCSLNHGIADPAFVLRHCANSMEASTSRQEEVWYVNSGASNHMKIREWFTKLYEAKRLGYVETGDDTVHNIEHVGDLSLSHVG